jgi:arsenical pump membrane protein
VRDLALVAILVATIVALYVRPRSIHDWQVALVGGLLAWLAGPLWFRGGIEVLRDSTNILAFFLGLMLISAAIETAGLYAAAAALLTRAGRRQGLLVPVLMLGTVVTAVLSNDATPLLLAPAVLAISREARASLLGVTFVADGASLLLPVSNPVNLLFYERLDIGFERWSTEILPAAAAGIAVLAVVHARRSGWRRHEAAAGPPPATPREARWYRLFVAWGAVALGCAYVGSSAAGLPLGAVSLAGGLVLAAPAVAGQVAGPGAVRRHLSPGLFAFVAGLLLLVDSGQAEGIFGPVATALDWIGSQPAPVTVVLAAAAAALLSNVMNNWPAALLISAAIGATQEPSNQLVAGALIGCTIGANFTVVGSLSTFFWLTLLKVHDVSFSPAGYARAAFWPTFAGVAAACAVAAVTTL